MLKATLSLAIFVTALATIPAHAQVTDCAMPTVMKIYASVSALPDGPKKTKALQELYAAKASNESGDTKGCVMHMNKGATALK